MTNRLRSLLLGLACGDALGVPYEFLPRAMLRSKPCLEMIGFGTHGQPPGTWSDDTSMALVLTENLVKAGSLEALAMGFGRWFFQAEWTARGEVFDYGGATATALQRLQKGASPRDSGGRDEKSNGNGSLMRTLPLAWFVRGENEQVRRARCFEVSAITHAHLRSQLACWLLVEVGVALLDEAPPAQALEQAWSLVDRCVSNHDAEAHEWKAFSRCRSTLVSRQDDEILASGYVVHTLEAALWCLLTSGSYSETVLKAVNLGEDTDTTAAVAGGLAGLVYGEQGIPAHWLEVLARRDEIVALSAV